MARRSNGPWQWEGRPWWYVHFQGRRVNLGTDDAEEAMRRWHRLQAGQPLEEAIPAGAVTFAAIAEQYLAWLDRERSESHYRTSRDRLLALGDSWGTRAAVSLSLADVEALMASRPSWGKTRREGVKIALRACLRWAVRRGVIPANPLAALQVSAFARREHVVSPAELKAWIASARPCVAWALRGLAASGARPSELLRAQPCHLDADGGAIRLPSGKQGARQIHFPRALRAELVAAAADGREWLYPAPEGGKWRVSSLGEDARAAREEAGLEAYVTPYALRHTWITSRVREGVPLGTIARMVGTSLAMISARYAHLSDGDARAVADRL